MASPDTTTATFDFDDEKADMEAIKARLDGEGFPVTEVRYSPIAQ